LNTTVKILDQLQLYIISIPLPPIITLFPYTTLFRSSLHTKRRNLSTIPPTPFPFFVHACKIWLSSDYAHPPLLDRLHPRPQPSYGPSDGSTSARIVVLSGADINVVQ